MLAIAVSQSANRLNILRHRERAHSRNECARSNSTPITRQVAEPDGHACGRFCVSPSRLTRSATVGTAILNSPLALTYFIQD